MSIGKNKNIIIGIDPGIADTGYGVIKQENGNLEVIVYGSIKTSAKINLANRLLLLKNKLSDILKKYHPQIAIVEQLFFCSNTKTALTIGQARGVIMATLAEQKIKIIELTPLQVKQGLTGYGKANKKQMQQMIKLILNLKEIPQPDDAADALAMAVCGATIKNFYIN